MHHQWRCDLFECDCQSVVLHSESILGFETFGGAQLQLEIVRLLKLR